MYATQRIGLGLVVALSAVACGEGGHAHTLAAQSAAGTIAALRAYPALESRVGAGQLLQPGERGFHLAQQGHALHGELPRNAREPLRIALGDDPDFSIEVTDPDLAASPGQVVEGAVVYRDALAATDLVHVSDGSVFEELRLLRDPSAPTTIHYRIARGDHAHGLRITDERLEIIDASGKVRIVGDPPFAVDAHGVKRPLHVRIAAESGQETDVLAELSTTGLAFPVAVDPIWRNAGSLITARGDHAAAALANGSIVISGGAPEGVTPLSSAEIWTAAAGWSSASNMIEARFAHTLTSMNNGKLLAVGGAAAGGLLATSSEVYTPGAGAGAWGTQVTAGFTPRSNHAASMLSTGFVVVTGGSSALTSAQIYSATANTWATAGTLNTGRALHASVVLAGDKVLVMGGRPVTTPLASVEVWNGTTTWTAKHDMNTPRAELAAVLLPTGKVLVVGGRGGTGGGSGVALATAEVYDPALDQWTDVLNTMSSLRIRPQAVVIQPTVAGDTAKVLVTGGGTTLAAPNQFTATADLYDPATNRFVPAESMVTPRSNFTLTAVLPNATAAVAAGGATPMAAASVRTSTSEIFDPLARRAGDICTAATDCLSNVCTDSHCCDTTCTGQCSACDVAGSEGTCSAVTLSPPHGGRTACANNFACVSGACATTCASDTQCKPGYFCGGNQCLLKGQPSASFSCTGSNQCANGLCTDNYCCDSSCTGECGACDVAAHLGTCFAVTGAPHTARAACAGTGVGTVCGPACNGVDLAACHYPTATKSCNANTCTTAGGISTETHASQCNAAGACSDVAKACNEYNCNGAPGVATACNTTCGNDNVNTNCASGYFCKTHVCTMVVGTGATCTADANCASDLPCVDMTCCGQASCAAGFTCGGSAHLGSCAKANGTQCSSDNECGNGHCVDGVCCDSACNTGQCAACDVVGKVGTCSPVAGPPHVGTINRKCSQAFLGTGACTAVCDGSDTMDCHYPDNSKPCGANACATDQGVGTETHTSVCDTAGHCQDAPRSCGNYACGASTCKTGCSPGATDCASGFYCAAPTDADAGADASVTSADGSVGLACIPVQGLGNKCTTGLDCQGGLLCTDGVCCGVDNCGAGKSCNIPGKEGRCAQPVGTACTDPSDCGPGGFCVDGFCCNSACTGQCEACNVSTSKGICSPVTGDPVGQRTACPAAAGTDPCSAKSCDGAQDRTQCVGHVGSKVSCRPASCAPATGALPPTATLTAACDGTGACPTAKTVVCSPFACKGDTCGQTCASDAECDPKYRCSNKQCVVGATCKDTHTVLSGDNKTTDCSPYGCVAGKCGTTCNSVADCAEGFACDDARQCVPLSSVGAGASSDQGGCGCRVGSSSSSQGWAALASLLGVASILTRRRRRSASLLRRSVDGAAAIDG